MKHFGPPQIFWPLPNFCDGYATEAKPTFFKLFFNKERNYTEKSCFPNREFSSIFLFVTKANWPHSPRVCLC